MATGLVSTRLIARENELSQLNAALSEARKGNQTVVLVSGEAGIGKSRLLEEFLSRARASDCRTVTGVCLEISAGDLPYVPFRHITRSLQRELGTPALSALLGSAAVDLGVFLPDLPRRQDDLAPEDNGRARIFDMVLRLVDRLAEQQPLVLAVEDVHWADRSTVQLLAYVMQGLAERPFLLIITYREEDRPVDTAWRMTFRELMRHGKARRLRLLGLNDEATVELVRTIRPDAGADLVQSVTDASRGVPYFVEELLAPEAHWDGGDLPSELDELLELRLAVLPEDSQTVVRCVATIGRDVEHRVVAAATGLSPKRLSDAIRVALERQILVWHTPSCYDFRHALARDVAYKGLLGERAEMHAAVARALTAHARRTGRSDATALGEIAHHWGEGEDDARAFVAWLDAARAASRESAYPEALRHYLHADYVRHQLDDEFADAAYSDSSVYLETAVAAHWANRPDVAADFLRRTVDAALANDDSALIADALMSMHNIDPKAATALAEEFGDPVTMACVVASELMVEGQAREAALLAREALTAAKNTEAIPQTIKAGYVLGTCLVMIGDDEEGLREIDEALVLAKAVKHQEFQVNIYACKAFALDWVGRLEDSLATSLAGIEDAKTQGWTRSDGTHLWANAADVLMRLGRLREAAVLIKEALDTEPQKDVETLLQIVAARIATVRGQFQDARVALERVEALTGLEKEHELDAGENYQLDGQLAEAHAELFLWSGKPELAGATIDQAIKLLRRDDVEDDVHLLSRLYWLGVRADADIVVTNPVDAEAVRNRSILHAEKIAASAHGLSVQTTGPGLSRDVAGFLALLAAELARLVDRTVSDVWHEALDAWRDDPYLSTYCRLQLGEALGLSGRKKEAAALLQVAYAQAVAADMGAMRAAVEGVGRAVRVTVSATVPQPRTMTRSAPFNLTDRELDVLRLLTEGLTNRMIARRLSVPGRSMSESTASVHVSHILAKLGVGTRTEAAAVAHRLQLSKDS
jgi:DNA-binding CsgD family transcriptional regulator/tetratricopeptide (TPR) repeat protein